MKAKYFLLASACALAFAGCQNDPMENPGDRSKMIVRSMDVDPNIAGWEDNAPAPSSRTIYESGVGVHLIGNEPVAVYYGKAGQVDKDGKPAYEAIIAANSVTHTNSKITFSHTAIADVEAYNYFFLLPRVGSTGGNSAKISASMMLWSVQAPTATSFDSDNDILVGRPMFDIAQQTEVAALQFKRLCVPLKVTVKDPSGLLNKEKLFIAGLDSNTSTADESQKAFSGLVYINIMSNTFAECGINAIDKTSSSDMLSASYKDGIDANADGSYTIWFVVNPITLNAGTDLTMTMTTATKTVSRTVTLNDPAVFTPNKINTIDFTLNNSETASSKSFVQQFMAPKGSTIVAGTASAGASQTVAMTASDGTTADWKFDVGTGTANAIKYQNNYHTVTPQYNLMMDTGFNGTITLPVFSDRKITKVTFLQSTYNTRDNNAANKFTLGTTDGNWSKECDFNGYVVNKTGGRVAVEIPVEQQGKPLKITRTGVAKRTVIQSMTFEYEDVVL